MTDEQAEKFIRNAICEVVNMHVARIWTQMLVAKKHKAFRDRLFLNYSNKKPRTLNGKHIEIGRTKRLYKARHVRRELFAVECEDKRPERKD